MDGDGCSGGGGWSSSFFSIDGGMTYYYLVDAIPYGIPNDGFFDELEGAIG